MEKTGGELKVSLKEVEFGTLDLINPDMVAGVYACLTMADTVWALKHRSPRQQYQLGAVLNTFFLWITHYDGFINGECADYGK